MPAVAQQLTVLGGASVRTNPHDETWGGLVEYSHELAPGVAASYAYRNEGHFPSHHRDGHSLQLWATSGNPDGLSVRAGLGAYRFFDTAVAESPDGFGNSHGWAILLSAAMRWHTAGSRWTWEIRADRVLAHESFETTQVLAGAGFALDQDGSFHSNATPRTHNAEFDLLAGKTIVNSFESENATASGIDVRYAFGPVLHASAAWVNEGDARLIRRNGLLAELWLEPSFAHDRYTLGVGLGAYFAIDEMYHSGPRVQAVISTTFSWNVDRRWALRLTWHRISSNYDRDSDIVLAGVGYRF